MTLPLQIFVLDPLCAASSRHSIQKILYVLILGYLPTYITPFFTFFSTLCSVVSVWLAFWRLYYLQKGIYVGEYWCFPNRLTTTTRFATNKISIMPLLFFFNSPNLWRVLSPSFQIQWKLLQLALLPL